MTTYGKTRKGAPINDALVAAIAAEAEAGFPDWKLTRPPGGRPPLDGEAPAATRTVRIPAQLDRALTARAAQDHTTPSRVMREALDRYLAA